MSRYHQRLLEAVGLKAAGRSTDPTRHKCFVSYHHDDQGEAETFVDDFGEVFIAKAVGVSDEDDFIDSDDSDYVMRRIRELYLTDSTVTIVLVGKCTWARRYVDWEVASTLRDDPKNKRSGLLAITLPSAADYAGKQLPARVNDNVSDTSGYARWNKYPTTKTSLQSWIDDAFDARTGRAHLIDNSRELFKYNRTCP